MRVVVINMEIKTKPVDVIRAFTEPDLLRNWWGVERTLIELKVDGLYTLAGFWKIGHESFRQPWVCLFTVCHIIQLLFLKNDSMVTHWGLSLTDEWVTASSC